MNINIDISNALSEILYFYLKKEDLYQVEIIQALQCEDDLDVNDIEWISNMIPSFMETKAMLKHKYTRCICKMVELSA